jgi:hypothetical protein
MSIREIEPNDPRENYSYSTGGLRFILRSKYSVQFDPTGIELWGSPQTADSLVTLKPGEWITVKGQVVIRELQGISDASAEVREPSTRVAAETEVEVAAQFVSGGKEYFFDAATSTEDPVCHPTSNSPVEFCPLKLILVKNSETVQK